VGDFRLRRTTLLVAQSQTAAVPTPITTHTLTHTPYHQLIPFGE
jgi:hypothetical protein